MASVSELTNAQCDINLGCSASAPIVNIDPPTFDPSTFSIVLNNIEFGGIECIEDSYQAGIAVYIYQLLPDGTRMTQCAVVNEEPYNVVGSVAFGFGQVSFCPTVVPIGSLSVGPTEGFEACDGAYLEIEAALFITDNLGFDAATTSVFSELTESEYFILNLGNLEININDEFPGQGQPLTTAKIKDFNSDSEGPIDVDCGTNIELYLEGLSRVANCLPYEDISTGITSELENEFYYRINGGEPIMVLDPSTGAAGGQLTGPDANIGDLCYAGVLTTNAYILEFTELPADLCDGSTIVFTLKTTDLFTNNTVEDEFTVIYTGGTGCGTACAVEPHCDSPCYAEYNPSPAEGSIADAAECLTILDCETIIAGGLEAPCADVANCATSTCPVVYLNDDNLPSLPNSLCEGDLLSLCFDLLTGDATFNPSLVEFNYELTFDGIEALVTLENSFSAGTQIDPNANGQICFETIIPEGPDPCQPFEISLTIESVFYIDDDTCPSNNIGFALNLSALPASEGDDLNSLVPLLSLAGFNPLTLTGYPNPNWTATVTQPPACDGSTLGVVEVYASNGALCDTVTDLGTPGVDGECPANNAELPEYTYEAFETFVVPDQNEMDSIVVNPCAISVTVPAQTISCIELCDLPGCTDMCATNYDSNATVDDGSCTLPEQPVTACYQTATFNETTCVWELMGEIAPEPVTACYETATFNDSTCLWEISGVIPPEPITACYETAVFNNATCMYDVTGEMPEQAPVACFQMSIFNDNTCMWEVSGMMSPEPLTACYETAMFNTGTCSWEISGVQPDPPTGLACYQSVGAFDDNTCEWQILGEQPPIDDGCDLTEDSFDEETCMAVNTSTCPDGTSLDEVNCICVEIPVPGCTNECAVNYNPEANQDDGTCMLEEEPPLACYQTATYNNTTCEWEIIGVQPEEPPLECYQVAEFDDASCMWIVYSMIPPIPMDLECYETTSFDDELCMWIIEGNIPDVNDACDVTEDTFDFVACVVINTPNCPDGTTFNSSACTCYTDPVPGCTDPCATNYDPNANVDNGSCTLPDPDDGCDLTEDTLDENCMIVNTPNCPADTEFVAADCLCKFIDVVGCTNPCASNYDPLAAEDDGSCILPDIDDGCDLTDDSFDDSTCMVVNTPNCPDGTFFMATICTCESFSCCPDPCALNYDPNCMFDDGSCSYPDLDDNCDLTEDTYDTNTCEIIHTPNCPDGSNFNAVECSCDTECVPPTPGTIDCE